MKRRAPADTPRMRERAVVLKICQLLKACATHQQKRETKIPVLSSRVLASFSQPERCNRARAPEDKTGLVPRSVHIHSNGTTAPSHQVSQQRHQVFLSTFLCRTLIGVTEHKLCYTMPRPPPPANAAKILLTNPQPQITMYNTSSCSISPCRL